MKNILMIVITTLILGCVSRGEYFSTSNAPRANEDTALVFFYRFGNYYAPKSGLVNIYANDEKIFEVADNGYTWFYLKPGQYKFKAEWNTFQKPRFENGLYDTKYLDIALNPGNTYYLNYQIVNEHVSSMNSFGLVGKILEPRSDYANKYSSVAIVKEEKSEAITDLLNCRYQQNLIMK